MEEGHAEDALRLLKEQCSESFAVVVSTPKQWWGIDFLERLRRVSARTQVPIVLGVDMREGAIAVEAIAAAGFPDSSVLPGFIFSNDSADAAALAELSERCSRPGVLFSNFQPIDTERLKNLLVFDSADPRSDRVVHGFSLPMNGYDFTETCPRKASAEHIPEGSIVSCNIRFLFQLEHFGGCGLQIGLRGSNGMDFLDVDYKPPPPPVVVQQTVACRMCGKEVIVEQSFSKLTFSYCSPKCLSNHRKQDFT
eukprot:GEMP01052445.1.p1 GENE.GEMP01052445.1~~GEMP01052445.1.p1  ORF type:complete len:252 (+),score=38.92 GEMP01052445.1:554-1309(+)